MRSNHKKLIFFIVMIINVIIIVELLGRGFYFVKFTKKEDQVLRALMGLSGHYDAGLVSKYKPHHYMVYCLNPESPKYYREYYGEEQPQNINRYGFRGYDFDKEKKSGVFRIICIGASTTFGSSEHNEEKTYPRMLEKALNARYESPEFQVINAGVHGWTSAESLINFQFRLLEFSPDMIIVYHGMNDVYPLLCADEGASDFSNYRKQLEYHKPGLLTRIGLRISYVLRLLYYVNHGLSSNIVPMTTQAVPKVDIEEVANAATGRHFRRNIESLVILSQTHGVLPVLVTPGHWHWNDLLVKLNQITRNIARAHNVLLVDFEPLSQPRYFLADRVHLTREGNVACVAAIMDVIATLQDEQDWKQ
ncbi:MAG: hypothetical protein GF384_09110 [Elusimicrobia bacterium]|nr:hypothetical protein [Elusimicrobiota bacterium]MBD3412744.1 hypothetical protein [Elusimicrobiota bacterium]